MFNPYAILGVLMSIIVAMVGGYVKGRVDADRSATISLLENQIKSANTQRDYYQQQLVKASEIAKLASARQAEVERNSEALAAEIESYAKKISASGACSLTDDDDKWLQSIGKRTAPIKGDPSGAPGGFRETGSNP